MIKTTLTTLWLALFSASVFAQLFGPGSEFVADRYFITFKPSAGLIDPPNPANPAPFGENSSGQSKELLAQTLDLEGEILRIFDNLNTIYVRMDAGEAKRWRQDPRVASVEQERTLSTNENEPPVTPSYRDNRVSVPVVDSEDQPALFQDGEFEFDPSINAWRLVQFRTTPVIPGLIDNVELVTTDTRPVQVFLKISSTDIACNEPGTVGVRKTGNVFEVAAGFTLPPAGTACAAVLVPFAETVQLPVFGLPAGVYQYTVNGEFSGSFELTEDNTL